jgi:hypothetical protein
VKHNPFFIKCAPLYSPLGAKVKPRFGGALP